MIPDISRKQQLLASLDGLIADQNLTVEKVSAFIKENRSIILDLYKDHDVSNRIRFLVQNYGSVENILATQLQSLSIKKTDQAAKKGGLTAKGIKKKSTPQKKEKDTLQISKQMISLKELGYKTASQATEYAVEQQLRGINLVGLHDLSDEHLHELLEDAQLITGIKLTSDRITSAGVRALTQQKNLQTLWITSDHVKEIDLRQADRLKEVNLNGSFEKIALPINGRLESLRLSRCLLDQVRIPDGVKKVWVESCPHLTQIILPTSIEEIVVQLCPRITSLRLDHAEKIKEATILSNGSLSVIIFPERTELLKKIDIECNTNNMQVYLPQVKPMSADISVK